MHLSLCSLFLCTRQAMVEHWELNHGKSAHVLNSIKQAKKNRLLSPEF